MKAIQVSLDENLLAQLDNDPEVRRDGRSAVVRRAIAAYLRERRAREIADAYRRAYQQGGGLGPEYAGWEDQAIQPGD